MLSTDQIGQRVVVRRRLPPTSDGTAPEATYGDVLGILESWTAGVLLVRRADGDLVQIEEGDVVAGKPIPPRPPRRRPRRGNSGPTSVAGTGAMAATGDRLAQISAAGWPAPESEPLGEWRLRAASGFTGRANSALILGTPGRPLDEALRIVDRFYHERGLPSWAQVIVDSPYEHALHEHGWTVVGRDPGRSASPSGHSPPDTVLVQTVELATLRRRLGERGAASSPPPVRLTRELTEGWFARYRGGTVTEAVRYVLTAPQTVTFAQIDEPHGDTVSDHGREPTAVGHGVVVEDSLGLAAITVAPTDRRRGLARSIISALADWGYEQGARWAHLQVGARNAAAIDLYEQLGFTTDHAYRYYAAPGASTPAP